MSLEGISDTEHIAMGKRTSKTKTEDSQLASSETTGQSSSVGAPMPSTLPMPMGSVKLPTFWEVTPDAWFIHVEAEFVVQGITDDCLRYHMVVAALPPSTAARLVGILKRPPPTDRYSAIKQRLLYTFGQSEEERADRLLAIDGLGERSPSELMDYMMDLMGAHTPGLLFVRLFMRALPGHVRAALASFPTSDLCALAREADKVWIAAQQPVSHRTLAVPAAGSQRVPAPAKAKYTTQQRQEGYCKFHQRFGKLAHRCIPPCAFPKQEQGNDTAGAHQ